jgi:very-short-patch-repair endonuclease
MGCISADSKLSMDISLIFIVINMPLIVEVDGGIHETQKEYDAERNAI